MGHARGLGLDHGWMLDGCGREFVIRRAAILHGMGLGKVRFGRYTHLSTHSHTPRPSSPLLYSALLLFNRNCMNDESSNIWHWKMDSSSVKWLIRGAQRIDSHEDRVNNTIESVGLRDSRYFSKNFVVDSWGGGTLNTIQSTGLE